MPDTIARVTVGQFGVGAVCVLLDGRGQVLLVRQTYRRELWALPGGNAEPGEAPEAAARRELLEETGLTAGPASLVGVYFQPDHEAGPFLHFAFRLAWDAEAKPVPDGVEIAEVRMWPVDSLPRPHTELTAIRIADAVADRRGVVATVSSRIIDQESSVSSPPAHSRDTDEQTPGSKPFRASSA